MMRRVCSVLHLEQVLHSHLLCCDDDDYDDDDDDDDDECDNFYGAITHHMPL